MSPVPERIICTRKKATISSDPLATRSERRRLHASAQSPGDTACCGLSKGIDGPLLELYPRIHGFVHEIREQVEHHGCHRDVDRDRLDHGEVAALDRENHLAADSGYREEALDEKRTDQKSGKLRH